MAERLDCGSWPERRRVFDVDVSLTDYDDALEVIFAAAHAKRPGLVDHLSVHGLVLARQDPTFHRALADFHLVAPDGQPVRWALNRFWGAQLADRVYGPELMLRICRRAAREQVPLYLYGGTPSVLADLSTNLRDRFPHLPLAGAEAPPFRPLTPDEDERVVERVHASGARIVFVGLGCPKQELFAWEHRERIDAVQMCVGAAFDFHAGVKPMAPTWLQDRGLEWVFRLATEPRRLAGRYLQYNTRFLAMLLARSWHQRR